MPGVWPIYFGPVGINLSIVILGLSVLVLATVKKLRKKTTNLLEISIQLLLVGVLFLTLHGTLLQLIFPISLPEKPLIDNNLTYNYALTNILAYLVVPVLVLTLPRRDVSTERVGLKVLNLRKTAHYTSLGVIFSSALYLLSYSLFGFKWVSGHTVDGLILWILLVSMLSVFTQVFFFIGILFNAYLKHENGILLATISILATQLFTFAPLPWVVTNTIDSSVKVAVTWKTGSIYGASLMSITTGLIDLTLQIL